MDDQQLIALYQRRSERALIETRKKYGRYCHCIAYRILQNYEDTEECLNDMLLKCWNVIPNTPPSSFRSYIAIMTRNMAVSKCRQRKPDCFSPLHFEEQIKTSATIERKSLEESLCDTMVIGECISKMLDSQTLENKEIFIRRYWEAQELHSIAKDLSLSEICVRSRIFRMRGLLRELLFQNGIIAG